MHVYTNLCMYVYIHTYIRIYICGHAHIYTRAHTHVYSFHFSVTPWMGGGVCGRVGMTGQSRGTRGVLEGYSWGTHGMPEAHSRGTRQCLRLGGVCGRRLRGPPAQRVSRRRRRRRRGPFAPAPLHGAHGGGERYEWQTRSCVHVGCLS